MAAAAPLAVASDPAHAEASTRALVDEQLDMLTRLARIGMEIAEAAGRRATALADEPGASADAPDPGLTYSRAARAVRLTIALQSRLLGERAAESEAQARARAAQAARRRDRIHARVERAIEAERPEADGLERDAEHLSSAAWERLTEEDDAGLLDRPIDEVVARICQDLGLSPAAFVEAGLAAPPARAAPPACVLRDAGPSRGSGPAPQHDDCEGAAGTAHGLRSATIRHAEERPSGRVSKHAPGRAVRRALPRTSHPTL